MRHREGFRRRSEWKLPRAGCISGIPGSTRAIISPRETAPMSTAAIGTGSAADQLNQVVMTLKRCEDLRAVEYRTAAPGRETSSTAPAPPCDARGVPAGHQKYSTTAA